MTTENLTKEEKKTIRDVSEYVEHFITVRFPEGLDEKLREILGEMVLDAFFDGSRYAEAQVKEESRVILAP